jgi:hypothetical protein
MKDEAPNITTRFVVTRKIYNAIYDLLTEKNPIICPGCKEPLTEADINECRARDKDWNYWHNRCWDEKIKRETDGKNEP